MNLWDLVIILLVAALTGLAIRRLIRQKKSGSCSCGCGGCSQRCNCAQKKQEHP